MILDNTNISRDAFLLTKSGQRIPLRIETVDFNPCRVGPEITGYLTGRPETWEIPRKGDSPIKDVIFNDPATIVLWSDGTKTVVKCQEGDTYSKELGLAMCISKKYLGNKGNFNEVFKKWIPDETPYTEEELSQLLQNIDFSKIGEALGNILYNFGKSLIETYGPEKENQEPEDDITDEAIKDALYDYCNRTPCLVCSLKNEDGNCKDIERMEHEELINTYKAIKKEDK